MVLAVHEISWHVIRVTIPIVTWNCCRSRKPSDFLVNWIRMNSHQIHGHIKFFFLSLTESYCFIPIFLLKNKEQDKTLSTSQISYFQQRGPIIETQGKQCVSYSGVHASDGINYFGILTLDWVRIFRTIMKMSPPKTGFCWVYDPSLQKQDSCSCPTPSSPWGTSWVQGFSVSLVSPL